METEKPSILIIDDDEQIRSLLKELLSVRFDCVDVSSAEEALSVLGAVRFNLVISDIQMGGLSGLDLVPRVLERAPETVVVMISGQQTIESAIEAMHVGAFDYITKPLDLRHVEAAVGRALDHQRLLQEKRKYEDHLEELVRERTARIEYLAFYDALTDLPNRALLTDRFEQALASASPSQRRVGLLLIALDRFKKINDTLGHEVGDLLLQQVAKHLRAQLREGETLARSGDDEFALLLTRVKSTEQLADVWQQLSETISSPFSIDGHEIYITASSGISLFPNDGLCSATIMKNASAALFRAKKQGGNNYQFYTADMNAQAIKRLALESSLRGAIQNREFVNYYQPVIDLSSGKFAGMEALVRWRHPELGVLSPAEFIGLAEDTGLIIDIGDQVMSAACAQARQWHENGYGDLRISVNVSPRQLRSESFVQRVVEVLCQTRLDPMSLELEITETSIMENADSAVKALSAIRKLGVRIAIDDFGTGYSSLSYLKRLPIDTVKLDQSFVKGATSDPSDAALVMAIITLAHNLRLRVIAEGVETEEQRAFLRLLRCDEGQGYLFGRPAPADAFESVLHAGPRRKQDRLLASPRSELNIARTAVNK
jgi:diguanylate cyclase (GGDEF)-like protein